MYLQGKQHCQFYFTSFFNRGQLLLKEFASQKADSFHQGYALFESVLVPRFVCVWSLVGGGGGGGRKLQKLSPLETVVEEKKHIASNLGLA